ncbi:MAG: hypothetical protein AB1546_15155 [bacterium]
MKRIVLSAVCGILLTALLAGEAGAISPKEVWDKMRTQWKNAEDIEAAIGVFTNYPNSLQKYFPESKEEFANMEEYWRYQVIKYIWKKPGAIHVTFVLGRHMGTDMVAKFLEKGYGTRLVFGFRDKEYLYAKFPPTDDPTINRSIERTIYTIKPDTQKYASGVLRLDYSGTLLDLLAEREPYFKTGKVAMTEGKLKYKKDFSVMKGKVQYSEASAPGDYYIITMKPASVEKNRGIEREVMYISKGNFVPAQLEIYHNNTIVACLTVTDVKTNAGITDELWKKFYKGANIMPPKK